ncbi:hypothetical protein [Antiquaquibacter soli]|uniref:Uncharacterized protein n=1 Tax=Antiquaquibacter soli TaxID=3064523 RepID=A0ABT9BJ10_9MICO|nr:hypothetical protein [Protaetiibacter sp. WY-16]MDO7881014.1 hypothetical protein [Protaetiibacter sp. WY-16]
MRRLAPVVVAAVAAALVLPVQAAIVLRWGEPYPALTQPVFRAPGPLDGEVLTTSKLEVVLRDAGGTEHPVELYDLLGTHAVSPVAVVSDLLLSDDAADDPAIRSWLRERVGALGLPVNGSTVETVWETEQRRIDDLDAPAQHDTLRRVTIELGSS